MKFWVGILLVLFSAYSSMEWLAHHGSDVVAESDKGLHHIAALIFFVSGVSIIYSYFKNK